MGYLSEKIEASVSETVAQWYETELNAAFVNTSATINMGAQTGGGCSANVVQNIAETGLDIVITQGAEAPYLADGGIAVSLCPSFLEAPSDANPIQEMTIKTFQEHETAMEYVRGLRDMAIAISELNGGKNA